MLIRRYNQKDLCGERVKSDFCHRTVKVRIVILARQFESRRLCGRGIDQNLATYELATIEAFNFTVPCLVDFAELL